MDFLYSVIVVLITVLKSTELKFIFITIHLDTYTGVQCEVIITATLSFRTWVSQKVWSRKNITLWKTKGCGALSSMRSESASLCSSTLLIKYPHINIVNFGFSLSVNFHASFSISSSFTVHSQCSCRMTNRSCGSFHHCELKNMNSPYLQTLVEKS